MLGCARHHSFTRFEYSRVGHRSVLQMQYHDGSCRAVQFSPDGHHLHTVSSDRSLATVDLAAARVLHRVTDAHTQPINCMVQYSDALVCTGDDEGEIKVWDTAGQECFKSLNRLYYRDVKACIFVHDVNRGTDYSSLDAWIDEFMETVSVSTQEYYVNKSSIAS